MEHAAKLDDIQDEIAIKEQVENWSHEANLPLYHGESGLGDERHGWLGLHADAHLQRWSHDLHLCGHGRRSASLVSHEYNHR